MCSVVNVAFLYSIQKLLIEIKKGKKDNFSPVQYQSSGNTA